MVTRALSSSGGDIKANPELIIILQVETDCPLRIIEFDLNDGAAGDVLGDVLGAGDDEIPVNAADVDSSDSESHTKLM